jgi:hypothetical protein
VFVATFLHLGIYNTKMERSFCSVRGSRPVGGAAVGGGTSRESVLPPPCDLGKDSNVDDPGRSNLPVVRTGVPGGIPQVVAGGPRRPEEGPIVLGMGDHGR